MKKIYYLFILIFSLVNSNTFAQNNFMILKLSYGNVEIELYRLSNHVKRFKELADSGKYDGVVFHRVIEGLWLNWDVKLILITQFLFSSCWHSDQIYQILSRIYGHSSY